METTKDPRVLVVGAGNIGGAMARGIAAGGTRVILFNRSERRLDAFRQVDNIVTTTDLTAALDVNPVLVLLCVETDAVAPLLGRMAPMLARVNPIIGSCAAVPTLADLENGLGGALAAPRIVRILPNIAATVGESVNLLASRNMTQEDMDLVRRLISNTGSCFEVPENLFGAAMAVSSCGIAFALRYVRASVEGAVQLGLAPGLATDICAAMLRGTAAMLAGGAHPETLVDRVTTPGGLTIRGLNAMEDRGFSAAVTAGILAAVKK